MEQDWTPAESSLVLVSQLHFPFLPQSSAVPGDSRKPCAREAAALGICNTGPSSCLQRKKNQTGASSPFTELLHYKKTPLSQAQGVIPGAVLCRARGWTPVCLVGPSQLQLLRFYLFCCRLCRAGRSTSAVLNL